MRLAYVGQVIEYKLDEKHKGGSLYKWAGETIGVEVSAINHEEKHYCVYAPYGPDHIPFDECTIITDPKVYCVEIVTGSYDDIGYQQLFATIDKSKAEIFVERFNKIIENNKSRISNHFTDDDWEKPTLFWYDFIHYEEPTARMKELKLR